MSQDAEEALLNEKRAAHANAYFAECDRRARRDGVALSTLLDYVRRSTHWEEGGATRHDALLALGVLGADVAAPYKPTEKPACWARDDTGTVTTSSNGSGLIEAQCLACTDDDNEGCPTCGEDGGTSCGAPNCGLLTRPEPNEEAQPVGSINKAHLKQQDGPWCKELLMYSPDNQGDNPGSRVMLYTAGRLDDALDWAEKGLSEWRQSAQASQAEARRLAAENRVAVGHLQGVLNSCRTSVEQLRADTAARDWLVSIGSEPT